MAIKIVFEVQCRGMRIVSRSECVDEERAIKEIISLMSQCFGLELVEEGMLIKIPKIEVEE